MIRFVQEFSAARVITESRPFRVQPTFPRTPLLDGFWVAHDRWSVNNFNLVAASLRARQTTAGSHPDLR